MKKRMPLFFMFLMICILGCNNSFEKLVVVTFNIRYDNPNDGTNSWENRVPLIESWFREEMPDLIGMQEVRHNQLLDLENILPDYAYVGTGRDDGKQGGEYTPVFFRKDRFNLIEDSQFWLSETPEVPGSKGWDAAITRIVTWAKFKHVTSGKEFYLFNTHFDHRGVTAREMSPLLLSQKIQSIAGESPVILTGDFNIRKNNSTLGSGLYDNLTDVLKEKNRLIYTLEISDTPVTTAGATSNGFRKDWEIGEPGDAIDYIFVTGHFTVVSYRVDRIMNGDIFISDHWPVTTLLEF